MPEQVHYKGVPDTKVIIYWVFSKLLLYTILFGSIFAYLGILSLGILGFVILPMLIGIIGVFIVLSFIYLIFLRKTYRYKITNKGVHFEGGIIVKKQKFVPFYKITDVILSQNIIEQVLGISKIGFQTAGAGGRPIPEIMFEGLIDPKKPQQAAHRLIEEYQRSPTSRYYSG